MFLGYSKSTATRRSGEAIAAAIGEEIKYYPTQSEFHAAMSGLRRLYVSEIESPLALSLEYHSVLANTALALVGRYAPGEDGAVEPNIDFLAGEMLALHALTKTRSREHRQHLLKQSVSLVYTGEEEDRQVAQRRVAERFLSTMDNPVEGAYEYFPEVISQKVVDAATLYDDSSVGIIRDQFVAGYTHSTRMIISVAGSTVLYPRSH